MSRYFYDSSNTVFDYPVLIPRNDAPFTEVFGDAFGRMVIYTYADHIDTDNIADELAKALPKHNWNAAQIAYLDRYYRGDQPILYREKTVRPEINNHIVENHAYELVESNVADLYGEPVQYALHNSDDEGLMEEINSLNTYMRSEDKPAVDIERGRWAAICGTSYLYVGGENRMPKDYVDSYGIQKADGRLSELFLKRMIERRLADTAFLCKVCDRKVIIPVIRDILDGGLQSFVIFTVGLYHLRQYFLKNLIKEGICLETLKIVERKK